MRTNTRDEPIDEVRETRRRISAKFGHDPQRLVEHYKKLEAESSAAAKAAKRIRR